jgi:hypothetical protein
MVNPNFNSLENLKSNIGLRKIMVLRQVTEKQKIPLSTNY